MTTTESVPVDRRHRRRLETIEEVLDHAVEIMATDGVAGLSLGEIARRMGIRPPSLYVYFPSKNALYDALFARGWRELLETMRAYEAAEPPEVADDLAAAMLGYGRTMGRWSVANIAYAQLLFWRPVPGFRPSDEAYAPAVELYDSGLARMRGLQESGALRPDVDVADVLRDWTVIVAGVVSQQLSNAPGESFDEGRFTSALPALVEMFVAHYGTAAHGRAVSPTTPSRRGHAGKR